TCVYMCVCVCVCVCVRPCVVCFCRQAKLPNVKATQPAQPTQVDGPPPTQGRPHYHTHPHTNHTNAHTHTHTHTHIHTYTHMVPFSLSATVMQTRRRSISH